MDGRCRVIEGHRRLRRNRPPVSVRSRSYWSVCGGLNAVLLQTGAATRASKTGRRGISILAPLCSRKAKYVASCCCHCSDDGAPRVSIALASIDAASVTAVRGYVPRRRCGCGGVCRLPSADAIDQPVLFPRALLLSSATAALTSRSDDATKLHALVVSPSISRSCAPVRMTDARRRRRALTPLRTPKPGLRCIERCSPGVCLGWYKGPAWRSLLPWPCGGLMTLGPP